MSSKSLLRYTVKKIKDVHYLLDELLSSVNIYKDYEVNKLKED